MKPLSRQYSGEEEEDKKPSADLQNIVRKPRSSKEEAERKSQIAKSLHPESGWAEVKWPPGTPQKGD